MSEYLGSSRSIGFFVRAIGFFIRAIGQEMMVRDGG